MKPTPLDCRMPIAACRGLAFCSLMFCVSTCTKAAEKPWPRHTIDRSSRGADGVRLTDANGDGLPDVATGWEEGGRIGVCINPGPAKAKMPWPSVTVGKVKSPEDAVLVDLDGDGAMDVVSSCEGRNRTMFVHWAPHDPQKYLDANAWSTEALPATENRQAWMFALPLDIDNRHGIDLVVGSKAGGATIGWLASPDSPRALGDWKLRTLYNAGWIMSLVAEDLDGDGDRDVVASDRKGKNRGVLWLENPGAKAATESWNVHRLGADAVEPMFLDIADLDGDGRRDIIASTLHAGLIFYQRQPDKSVAYKAHPIDQPEGTGRGKGVRVGDLDGDGRQDVVFSFEQATPPRSGVVWMSYKTSPTERAWRRHEVSGPEGIKYDLVQLLDLDADGDLDIMTCEERANLGVFWYENPHVRKEAP